VIYLFLATTRLGKKKEKGGEKKRLSLSRILKTKGEKKKGGRNGVNFYWLGL